MRLDICVISSVGRASALQAECRRFEPVMTHQAWQVDVNSSMASIRLQVIRLAVSHAIMGCQTQWLATCKLSKEVFVMKISLVEETPPD